MVSEIFDSSQWKPVEGFEFTDITYHRAKDQGTVDATTSVPAQSIDGFPSKNTMML